MPFLPNTLIVSPSGFGKSMSIASLPPDRTAIIDSERKMFPFATVFPKVYTVEAHAQTIAHFDTVRKDPAVQFVIVDSMTEILRIALSYCRKINESAKDGYAAFKDYNNFIAKLVGYFKSQTQLIFVMSLDDSVIVTNTDGATSNRRRATVLQGKEWEGKVESQFLTALYGDIRGGKHGFITRSDGFTSAKSPPIVFGGQEFIENDLKTVVNAYCKAYPQYLEKFVIA